MTSPNAIYIQDVFKNIVTKVSAEMTPILKDINDEYTGVHFQYGSGYEIIETLNQMTMNDLSYDKYPLICLFLDVKEDFNTEAGIYSTAKNIRIAICNQTESTFKADERDLLQFKPILTPIYQCLLRKMKTETAFFYPSLGFEHEAKRNYYWGREGVYGKEGAIFNDKLDAIELTFNELKIYETYCP